MASTSGGGVHLHWERAGEGPPLLLIMGLGGSSQAWYRLLPHLAGVAQAISFDNRGTGQSDRIRGPLSLADMAADAVAVLDAAQVPRAHVLGVSMGGMIAQHLALAHRDRVASLILGCTTPSARGGPPSWRLLSAAALRRAAPGRATELLAPALYAERTRREQPERIREDFAMRLREATPAATVFGQMRAIAGHDTRARLGELEGLPVTVIHGEQDALIAPERGRELARLIPGARHAPIAGAGHVMLTDAEQAVVAVLHEHLARTGAAVA
jgi:3-oxoadipate enol-lactonase